MKKIYACRGQKDENKPSEPKNSTGGPKSVWSCDISIIDREYYKEQVKRTIHFIVISKRENKFKIFELTQPGPLLNGSINFPDFFRLFFFFSQVKNFRKIHQVVPKIFLVAKTQPWDKPLFFFVIIIFFFF
jgi:hypothetical protein